MSIIGHPRQLLPAPQPPNAVNAAVADMEAKGQFYISQLSGPPLSIYDWRDRELRRWNNLNPQMTDDPLPPTPLS